VAQYVIAGWTGFMPSSCKKTALLIPENLAPYLWGWPHRFHQRMRAAKIDYFLVRLSKERHMMGFDSVEELPKIEFYGGGIWTDRIEALNLTREEE
jgi:glycerophosphoryl diester phosphodiesterase